MRDWRQEIISFLFRVKALALLRFIIAIAIVAHYHFGLMDFQYNVLNLMVLATGVIYSLVLWLWPLKGRYWSGKITQVITDYFFISFIIDSSGNSGHHLFFLYYLPIIWAAVHEGITLAIKVSGLAGLFLFLFQFPGLTSSFFMELASFLIVALFAGVLLDRNISMARTDLIRDSLTGLMTRTPFQEAVEKELTITDEEGLTLLVLDIDDFQSFNERYGFSTGDSVLKEMAELLKGSIRTRDLAARFGGAEFTVMLPATNQTEAYQIALRLKEALSQVRIPSQDQITVSIGLATAPLEAESFTGLLSLARKRMYRGKDLGGNRIVCTLAE